MKTVFLFALVCFQAAMAAPPVLPGTTPPAHSGPRRAQCVNFGVVSDQPPLCLEPTCCCCPQYCDARSCPFIPPNLELPDQPEGTFFFRGLPPGADLTRVPIAIEYVEMEPETTPSA